MVMTVVFVNEEDERMRISVLQTRRQRRFLTKIQSRERHEEEEERFSLKVMIISIIIYEQHVSLS